LARATGGRVRVDEILELPAARMHTVAGFETAVFSYFSDIPFLSNWGTPLLLGPGSIHVAHTEGEHVPLDELSRAVDVYATLASALLAS
jgi:acetylornithine deacetylase